MIGPYDDLARFTGGLRCDEERRRLLWLIETANMYERIDLGAAWIKSRLLDCFIEDWRSTPHASYSCLDLQSLRTDLDAYINHLQGTTGTGFYVNKCLSNITTQWTGSHTNVSQQYYEVALNYCSGVAVQFRIRLEALGMA